MIQYAWIAAITLILIFIFSSQMLRFRICLKRGTSNLGGESQRSQINKIENIEMNIPNIPSIPSIPSVPRRTLNTPWN